MRTGHRRLGGNAILQVDPTRTTGLRARYLRDVNRRWSLLQRDIATSIIDNDVFGIEGRVDFLQGTVGSRLAAMKALKAKDLMGMTLQQQLDAFMVWVEQQEALGILDVLTLPGSLGKEPWTNAYVTAAYRQGVRRSRTEMGRAGYNLPPLSSVPGGIGSVLKLPLHANALDALHLKTFEDLKTVTQFSNGETRRLIAEGLREGLERGIAQGQNARKIARLLVKDVNHRLDQIGKVRARVIARTEVIRAHHLATVAEYELAQVEGVRVMAEFTTAGFGVCPICLDLEDGNPYTLDEIRGMIPAHPNCRCAALPLPFEQGQRVAA